MVFSIKSAFTLTGNATKTLNDLTNTPVTGNTNINALSTTNFVNAGDMPNAANQLIFMNQPLSWWLACLNSGAIQYTPVSSNVNWSYIDSNGNHIYIGMPISNLIIPNQSDSVMKNSTATATLVGFISKHGLGRVDTHSF